MAGIEHRSSPCCRGFTLIEIAFAVFILSLSLVTILGLQSSVLQRSVRDRNAQQAMLLARQILSSIEASILKGKELDLGDHDGTPEEVAARFVPLPEGESSNNERFMARVAVSRWPIEGVNLDVVRRIDVIVYWSPNPNDRVEVTYFIPIEPPSD